MTTGSQAEFARKYGYSKAAITQFKKAGRLVFVSPGVLDFEASRQRIIDTADPNRADVAKRHAKLRNEDNNEYNDTASSNSFQNARTVREKYLALSPAFSAINFAVRGLSPVTITVLTPILRKRSKRSEIPGLIISCNSITP